MDTATIIATIYAVGFVVTAVLVAANTVRNHREHSDFEAGIIGLVAGIVWPFVAAAWGLGQIATFARHP